MRGIESRGMLLACDYKDGDKDCVEVLSCPWAKPGTQVILSGSEITSEAKAEIEADTFFQIQIETVNKSVQIAGINLTADGKNISTQFAENGEVC